MVPRLSDPPSEEDRTRLYQLRSRVLVFFTAEQLITVAREHYGFFPEKESTDEISLEVLQFLQRRGGFDHVLLRTLAVRYPARTRRAKELAALVREMSPDSEEGKTARAIEALKADWARGRSASRHRLFWSVLAFAMACTFSAIFARWFTGTACASCASEKLASGPKPAPVESPGAPVASAPDCRAQRTALNIDLSPHACEGVAELVGCSPDDCDEQDLIMEELLELLRRSQSESFKDLEFVAPDGALIDRIITVQVTHEQDKSLKLAMNTQAMDYKYRSPAEALSQNIKGPPVCPQAIAAAIVVNMEKRIVQNRNDVFTQMVKILSSSNVTQASGPRPSSSEWRVPFLEPTSSK